MAEEIKKEFPYPVEARTDLPESTESIVATIPSANANACAWVNDYEFEDEIEVPERNYPVSETVLERAIKHKRRIAIRPGRLKFLQYLERNMPEMIKEAMTRYKNEKLGILHKKDKENPSAMIARVKRYVEKNRDVINARRREKRQKAKPIENIVIVTPQEQSIISHTDSNITVKF